MAQMLFFEKLELKPDPARLAVELTSVCNFSCPMCRQHAEPPKPKWASQELMETILELVKAKSINNVLSVGLGENLLHPKGDEFFSRLIDNVANVTFVTNGTHLSEKLIRKCLDRNVIIRFSVDATSEATYKVMRHPEKWDLILSKINLINQIKKEARSASPALGLSVVFSQLTYDDFLNLPDFCQKYGIQYVSSTYMLSYNEELFQHSAWQDPDKANALITRVGGELRAIGVEASLPPLLNATACHRQSSYDKFWASPEAPKVCQEVMMPWICADGTVAACCNSYINIGNLNDNRFDDIWHGAPLDRIWSGFHTGNIPSECRKCSSIVDVNHKGAHFLPEDSEQQPIKVDQRLEERVVLPSFAELQQEFQSALVALRQGGFEAAIPLFESALAKNPYFYEIHNNLANCLLSVSQFDRALHHLNEARRLSSEHPIILQNVQVYQSLGLLVSESGASLPS